MAKYWLHIEAVNLGRSIYDTTQLSVIRGASLELRAAVADEGLLEAIKSVPGVKAMRITQGASVAGFEVECGATVAVAVEHAVARYLNASHACHTFAIGIASQGQLNGITQPIFERAREQAMSTVRWRQMQALALAPEPDVAPSDAAKSAVCTFTNTRIASKLIRKLDGVEEWGSTVVDHRFDYGRAERRSKHKPELHRFYEREADLASHPTLLVELERNDSAFSDDFSEIAVDRDRHNNPLSGKLAVLYADGNRFSKIVKACEKPEQLAKLDWHLRGIRETLLRALIEPVLNNNVAWVGAADRKSSEVTTIRRFETLLWGGDELVLVVPAWCGFALLHAFSEALAKTKLPEGAPTSVRRSLSTDDRLTNAVGLVFCNHKTPIDRIRKLAEDLAQHGKNCMPKEHTFDSVTPLVLESIDFPNVPIAEFWRNRLQREAADQMLRPVVLRGNPKTLKPLIDDFPRAQLHALASSLSRMRDAKDFDTAYKRFDQVLKSTPVAEHTTAASIEKAFRAVFAFADGKPAPDPDLAVWMQLREWIDYLAPEAGP